MLWITLLFAGLVAALAVGYVVYPLLRPGQSILVDTDGPLTDLILRKDTVLQSIKENEFDYQTGKLNVEDFQRTDIRLRHQAITLMRQIEQNQPAIADLDAALEEEIRSQRTPRTPAPLPTTTQVTRTCPQCHAPVQMADNFCPKCGFALAAVHAPAEGIGD